MYAFDYQRPSTRDAAKSAASGADTRYLAGGYVGHLAGQMSSTFLPVLVVALLGSAQGGFYLPAQTAFAALVAWYACVLLLPDPPEIEARLVGAFHARPIRRGQHWVVIAATAAQHDTWLSSRPAASSDRSAPSTSGGVRSYRHSSQAAMSAAAVPARLASHSANSPGRGDPEPHTGVRCCCLSSTRPRSLTSRSRWIASCGTRATGSATFTNNPGQAGTDDESRARYREKIAVPRHTLLDLLEAHPECDLPFAEFLDLLSPLRPRFYSISSSPEPCRIASRTAAASPASVNTERL